jgi:four helix bundle protein
MAKINSFRELNVYKSAREAARAIFEISKTFPREERYSLTDQIRRSSRAVNAMIAEAWAKRRYEAAFVSKVNDALGEATETQSWLDHALDSGYIAAAQYKDRDAEWQQIGGMLNKMTERAHDFCKAQAR